MVDPISIIVGALVAGASAAAKDTTTAAVKDAYSGLKALIVNYWKNTGKVEDQEKNQARAEDLIQDLEADPETYQKPALVKLKNVMPDPSADILAKAQNLQTLLEGSGVNVEQYIATVENSKNVIVGHGNSMTVTEGKP